MHTGSTSPRLERWAASLAAAVAVLTFLSTLPNDYCYDDDVIVRSSRFVDAPGQWTAIWTSDYWASSLADWPRRDLLYRPITIGSFRLVRVLLGDSALPQHLVNVLLHGLIAGWVVRLTREIGLGVRVAMMSGVLFAVLPIHTEAVAPVVGRADLIVAAATLISLTIHRSSMIVANPWRRGSLRAASAIAVFVALGAKESGLGAIPLLFLLEAYSWERARDGGSSTRRGLLSIALRLSPYVVPLAAYLALRYVALDGHLFQHPAPTKSVNALIDCPPWQRLLGVFQIWGLYWAKTVWPRVLCVSYAINAVRPATTVFHPHVVIGLLVALTLFAASVVAWRRKNRTVAFVVVALIVTYLPTSNAFVLMQVFFAERIWYLPSIWACLLASMIAGPLLRDRVWQVAGAVVVSLMIARCWIRNSEWRDNGTLYAACYRDHRESIACLYLYGQWLSSSGEFHRGIGLLNRATEIDLGYTDAHRALGRAYLKTGRLHDAIRHLQIADMQVPNHGPTVEALKTASAALGVHDVDSLRRLEQEANHRPDESAAEIAYVRALCDAGRVRDALARLQAREAGFSTNADWQHQYAVTLVLLDERDAAIDRYRQTLELASDTPQVAVELAMLLLERRAADDLDQAGKLCSRAEQLAPAETSVAICKAELLALGGDVRGAIAAYQGAINALPADSPQRRVLEERAKSLGR